MIWDFHLKTKRISCNRTLRLLTNTCQENQYICNAAQHICHIVIHSVMCDGPDMIGVDNQETKLTQYKKDGFFGEGGLGGFCLCLYYEQNLVIDSIKQR